MGLSLIHLQTWQLRSHTANLFQIKNFRLESAAKCIIVYCALNNIGRCESRMGKYVFLTFLKGFFCMGSCITCVIASQSLWTLPITIYLSGLVWIEVLTGTRLTVCHYNGLFRTSMTRCYLANILQRHISRLSSLIFLIVILEVRFMFFQHT